MMKAYPGEQWKNIAFDFDTNDRRMEISSFGRLRSFNKLSNGDIVNGSMTNGYRIIRLKFFKPKDEKAQELFENTRQQVTALTNEIKALKNRTDTESLIENKTEQLLRLKKNLAKEIRADEKKRTIYYHALIHRLVATYFVKQPSADHTVVAHLDHNKLNNRSYNLQWMTADENYAHQKMSPHVIEEKEQRRARTKNNPTTKLTVTKVMFLKKLLNENKPIKHLAKQFKVTDTQIIRIKKGENWGDIKAAK